MLHLKYQHIQ